MDAKERINFANLWDEVPTLATEASTVLLAGSVIVTCFDRITTRNGEYGTAAMSGEFFHSFIAGSR
jgi:hypothetical protein